MQPRRLLLIASSLSIGAGCAALVGAEDVGYEARDAGPPATDAHADAGPPALGPRFCASSDASICEDFDDDAGFTRWDTLWVSEGGAAAVVASDRSPPSAFNVLTPPCTSDSGVATVLSKTLNGNVFSASYAFDVSPRQVAPSPGVAAFIRVVAHEQGVMKEVYLSVDPTTVTLSSRGTTLQSKSTAPLPNTHAWTRVTLTIDAGTAEVQFDGVTQAVVPVEPMNPAVGELHLGLLSYGGTYELAYDNVEVRLF